MDPLPGEHPGRRQYSLRKAINIKGGMGVMVDF